MIALVILVVKVPAGLHQSGCRHVCGRLQLWFRRLQVIPAMCLMHLAQAAGAHMQPPKQQLMRAAAQKTAADCRPHLKLGLHPRLSVTTCCSCSTSATCRGGLG